MEQHPLLSIVIPVYNTGKLLPRCIESLKSQNYPNLELILVDDGSTDDSGAFCDRLADEWPQIRVCHKQNGGLGFARNSGLDIATGEYVAFLDSDDYVDPDMYRHLMEAAAQYHADAVFCDFSIVRRNGTIEPMGSALKSGCYHGEDILLAMLGAMPEAPLDFEMDMSVWKAVYSRKLIEKHSIRFVSERVMLCEDLFFHLDFLLQAETVVYTDRKLHFYCENNGSLTHRYIANRLEREILMFREVCQRAQVLLKGDALLRWHRLFLGRIRSTIGQQVHYKNDGNFFARLRAIGMVADHPVVREIIKTYPIGRNPIKLRIFNTLLKCRFCAGMYLLIMLNR